MIDPSEDPVALRSPRLHREFLRYLQRLLPRHFHGVRVSREGTPNPEAGFPLIIYCNHPSWWDPLLLFILAENYLPDWEHYGPMDAASLAQYPVLRRLGVFGLEPGARGASQFFRISGRVLRNSGRALWVTAEGHFTDPRVRPVQIRPGLAHLAHRIAYSARFKLDPIIMPLALDYPFWNESKPEALARFGEPIVTHDLRTVEEWHLHLTTELTVTMDALTDEAISRDPELFYTVLAGRTGIGGVYDLWRRVTSWARLRRFDPSHER
jgi:1-acyl-sn-glycerol-3-phosphate acyltransferase